MHKQGQLPRTDGPRIINVGVPGPGTRVALWHRAWRDKILPAVVNFNPDLIIVSAGFDAHRKDEINFQYIGVREADFEWITDQIVQVSACSSFFAAIYICYVLDFLTFWFHALPYCWYKLPATSQGLGPNFLGKFKTLVWTSVADEHV